ncbi:MAG: hypothetical protein LAP85_12005 [Acidobacteriia bacterium]|nr:hypothetical protein [Terriglobia bacterium]
MNIIVRLRKPICCRFPLVGLPVLALALLAGTVGPLPAQSLPSTSASGAEAATAPDAGAKEEKQAAQAASPAKPVAAETLKIGAYDVHSEVEFGYRWSSGIGGNDQMFRSQVNLFEGARLLGSYVTLRSTPGTGLFDRMDLSLNNWGDPYNTVRFNLGRMDLYDFRASYRNLNYYNFISSIDNPLLAQGNPFAQHNLNANYRMSNFDLRLFPNHKIVPFVGYSHNSAAGPGFTTVDSTGNEFLLQTQWKYAADEVRGGVQFNLPLLNLTVEQGFRYLRNDTGMTDAGQPQGNEGSPTFLGNVITLNSLDRGYHGRTKLPTTKVLAKFTPFQNLRMIGRYMYTMGDLDSSLGEIRTGGFVDLGSFLAYSAAADGFSGRAKSPNHNGSFLIEYSPISRITLTDNVDTLDYHISGAAALSTLFLNASSLFGPSPKTNVTVSDLLNTNFAYNEVRNQAEAEIDLGYGFAARVGHRYTFVDVTNNDSEDTATSSSSRNTGILGLVYRPGGWLRFGADYENTQTNRALTRTDLFNYDQINLDWRVGTWKGFSFNGRIGLRHNKNNAPDIGLKSHDQNYIVGLNYEPNERYSINVDYSRTDLFSDLLIVLPQNLQTTNSIFDERVSGIGGRMGISIYKGSKVELGYRGVINRGSFPLDFHQPFVSLWVPLGHNLAFKPSWQYFGYNQQLFGLENYQTHLVTFSLVYSR